MSEQECPSLASLSSSQPCPEARSPTQQVVSNSPDEKKIVENLGIPSNGSSIRVEQQSEQIECNPPGDKHTFEEDVQSCWSDSLTSNCDQTLSSPSSYNPHSLPASDPLKTTSDRKQVAKHNRTSKEVRSSACYTSSSGGRNVRKRVMANERERERTKSLNQALEILRDILPVPEAEKRSKIQTLRMAKDYIEFLDIYMRSSPQQPPASATITAAHRATTESSNQNGGERPQSIQCIHQFNNDKPYQLTTSGSQVSLAQASQPDSPLTYKFYKFRLKSQNKNDT